MLTLSTVAPILATIATTFAIFILFSEMKYVNGIARTPGLDANQGESRPVVRFPNGDAEPGPRDRLAGPKRIKIKALSACCRSAESRSTPNGSFRDVVRLQLDPARTTQKKAPPRPDTRGTHRAAAAHPLRERLRIHAHPSISAGIRVTRFIRFAHTAINDYFLTSWTISGGKMAGLVLRKIVSPRGEIRETGENREPSTEPSPSGPGAGEAPRLHLVGEPLVELHSATPTEQQHSASEFLIRRLGFSHRPWTTHSTSNEAWAMVAPASLVLEYVMWMRPSRAWMRDG